MAAKEKFYNIEFLHVEVPAVTWFKKLSAAKNPEERAFPSRRGGGDNAALSKQFNLLFLAKRCVTC